jgi:hypothetical protein
MYLAKGTSVVAARGALNVTEPPQWLGEQIRQPSVRVCANAAHTVQEGGWIRLDALEDCRVRLLVPARAASLLQRLQATVQATWTAWQQSARRSGAIDGV